MINYSNEIEKLQNPTFGQIVNIAKQHCGSAQCIGTSNCKPWNATEHGTALLDTHEKCCKYLCAYGEMHKAKIHYALSKLTNLAAICRQNFSIIDWGCGQGLATVCFFDYLNTHNIADKTYEVILIEPSGTTRNRAKLHVNAYLKDDSKIRIVGKYLNDVTREDIKTETPITFHFFSNILDIKQIDLKSLAQKVGENVTGEHYFICLGPINSGNHRIDAFYNYFATPETFADIEQSENKIELLANAQYNKDAIRKYTLKLKIFKFESNKTYYIPIDYYPSVQFHAAQQLDCVKTIFKTLSQDKREKIIGLYKYISNFELSALFDISASIYDEVHPVLAVLNNIVTRGLPTRTSPFIEEKFSSFGNCKQDDYLGSIQFGMDNINAEDLFLSLHIVDSTFRLSASNYNTKVLDSDLEKNFITQYTPEYLRQLLQPQRSLQTITNHNSYHSQRVDFACEFPYPQTYNNRQIKGFIVELDGRPYHYGEQQIADQQRNIILSNNHWQCLRITDNEVKNYPYNNFERFSYIAKVKEAFDKQYDDNWKKHLQLSLSPIAIARVQKTVLEALMTGRLNLDSQEWNILIKEQDVPCAALAFEDLQQMFEHITALLDKGKNCIGLKLPKVNLEIISTREFQNSALHLNIKPTIQATDQQQKKEYDMVIDIAVLRRTGYENNSFSEFKCKNNCYFNIRSSHFKRTNRYIYTSGTIDYKPLVTKDQQGNYTDIADHKEHLKYFLQLLFRKEDFRPGQLPILSRALQNQSVIGLLPTGGGKSLTYQIAAMLQPGVTLVIDPLRSLMKDQYDGLINAGIDTCTFINSTLDTAEKGLREQQMESSQMQFVFLSPERLCIYKFRERLRTMRDMHVYFAYGVIDEVHCVSEWGHDFRFSYLHLGRNLYKYVCPKDQEKHLTLFGLTATASFDVLADVERELSGDGAFSLDSDTIVRYENTNRLELQYKIEKVDVEYEPEKFFDKNGKLDSGLPKAVNIGNKWAVYEAKQKFLTNYIPAIPQFFNELLLEESENRIKNRFNERQNLSEKITDSLHTDFSNDFYRTQQKYEQAGIIFCPHRDSTGISVNVIANALQKNIRQIGTFMGSGEDDNTGEIDKTSFENLDKFRDNKLPLMVATKAFGMGIDKPNVRFTVNMNYSSSLESFVQEAGRAGRDKKMALSIILFADYKLVRINPKCPITQFPLFIIRNKWFKKEDLDTILQHYNISIDNQYIDHFTPKYDLVKLRCEISNQIFAFGECQMKCDKFNQCDLCKIPKEAKGFQYYKDLEQLLKERGFEIPKKNLEYLSADYDTVLFFYNNNFKGSLLEKQTMHKILSRSETKFFENDDEEDKADRNESVNNFLAKLLSSEVGTELVAFISYANNYADYAKAIYRMCCIELIDDFTQDYAHKYFRIVIKRKAEGEYYQGLKRFLMRYYSADRAKEEIQKVPSYRGDNEIHKCLGYLTEFIYDKIAVKRKRAIDDMRQFCIEGLNDTKDWKEVNEDLKDFIYYYFNSKYAKNDYTADNGEEFSLTKDTDSGKQSNIGIVFKYMRVIDDELVGAGGTPKDNIKHLQGAVRLIRRSLTDTNPALDLLNAFCLFYLGINNNEMLENELIESYSNGLLGFKERENNIVEFWRFFDKLNSEIDKKSKDFPDQQFIEIKNLINLEIHAEIIREITNKYIS